MNALCKLIILAVLTLSTTLSFATTSEWNLSDSGMDYALTQLGASYRIKEHTLIILIDQGKVLEHLDEQINNGIYNSDYSKNDILTHPLAYLTASALYAGTFIIPHVYQDHPRLNYIRVEVYIKYENIMGNNAIGPLLSFNMSRNLSDQINWTRFIPANSKDVYPYFRLSNLALSELAREKF